MEHQAFLIIAYMAIWIGLAGYIVSLGLRQKKIARQIDVLNKRFETRED
jgi:CcmD family protein